MKQKNYKHYPKMLYVVNNFTKTNIFRYEPKGYFTICRKVIKL